MFEPRHNRAGITLRRIIPLAAEAPKLILLLAATAGGFALTRSVAAYERRAQLQEATAWAERGRVALAANRAGDAVAAFRRAVARDRSEDRYATALATALTREGQLDAAEQILLSVRDRLPEDPLVNLQLARLAAREGHTEAAVRYYRSALYAPWKDQSQPLGIRIELGEFLLDHDHEMEAEVELVAAAGDPSVDQRAALRIGGLLLRAGDASRALNMFRRVLATDRSNPAALLGAGTAAFRLQQFRLAMRYLETIQQSADAQDMYTLAQQVLGRDPLAPRLGLTARRRRTDDNLSFVSGRLQSCARRLSGAAAEEVFAAGHAVDAALQTTHAADRDVLEDALATVANAEQTLARRCGSATPTDRALLIINELHEQTP